MQHQEIIDAAIRLAENWQTRANQLLTPQERQLQIQMKRLLTTPRDKVLLTRLIDQSFRSAKPERVANQIGYLLASQEAPSFVSTRQRLLLHLFKALAGHGAALTVPKLIAALRKRSGRVILPGESAPLHAHLRHRRDQGIRMNINHLGEAVLGEEEARRRMATYMQDLADPDIEYISIKISTLYSQIHPLAFEHSVQTLSERLSALYRQARSHMFIQPDGSQTAKLVNLDMEAFRDLAITYAAFTRTLDQDEFLDLPAGIVLQAYLPDSWPLQRQLTSWARKRVAKGGAPIRLRIVKGANMEMEKLESSLFNWPLAPYDNKPEVDANYKRMIRFALEPKHSAAVHLGVASHNLFELAYAAQLAKAQGVGHRCYFEMLEGMADHVRRALAEDHNDVLLYAPVASKDEFINAIAYLIRRLDENTSPENFLRYSPELQVDSEEWMHLKKAFIQSFELMESATDSSHRVQDRGSQIYALDQSSLARNQFLNEPDTDWSLAANRDWAAAIRKRWRRTADQPPLHIPLVIGGEERSSGRHMVEVFDPGQLPHKVLLAQHALASITDAEEALRVAVADPDGWRELSVLRRHQVLAQVALEVRAARADLIGVAAAETGKLFTETDVEVSEAIDFLELYPLAARRYDEIPTIETRGRGVGLIIAPWNFPVAIPCGGLAAALAAGNTVLFKPASAAVVTAYHLCQCFWRAGISRNTLQFIPCSGGDVGPSLTSSPEIDFTILTGGTDTGRQILAQSPDHYLAAETGGKNATIVTEMADRDQAIKNVISSAFSNGGQKCSATSLLILERSIYHDPHFRAQLVDAARSLQVGSPWDFASTIGPLIQAPKGDLLRALTQLEPGEEWALKPEPDSANPCLWSPGIKYGVQPGGFTHSTEFFGPVLGVMCADTLPQAIDLVNQTGYGLTSGLESLDLREQKLWQDSIRAGNLYLNRGTTGAITLRQPFGGMGKSALGPGLKAGSFEYVSQFMKLSEQEPPSQGAIDGDHPLLILAQQWRQLVRWGRFPDLAMDLERTCYAIHSYLYQYQRHFSRTQEYFHLRGQDNLLRFRPLYRIIVRVTEDDSLFDIAARLSAARISRCETVLSLPPTLDSPALEFLCGPRGKLLRSGLTMTHQDDQELLAMLGPRDRLRYAAPDRVPQEVLAHAARSGLYIARTPVYMEGRLELLQYFQQQAICNNYHRYGNLGHRAMD